jgi:two-component system NarL family sensor kinase
LNDRSAGIFVKGDREPGVSLEISPKKGKFSAEGMAIFSCQALIPVYMRRSWLFFIVVWMSINASAQTWEQGRDSLLRVLSHMKDDSDGAMAMIYLGAQYEYNRQDSALYYFRRAYELSKRVHFVRGMVNGLSLQAGVLTDQSRLGEAITLDSQAIVLSAKAGYKPGLAAVYNNIALAYDRLGDEVVCIDYYLKAIGLDEELHDTHRLSVAYSNIGGIYNNLKEYGKGYAYSLKGILLGRQCDDAAAIESGAINLGSALIRLKRLDTALVVLNDAKAIAKDLHEYDIADLAMNDICAIYQERRQLELLKRSATELMEFARSVGELQGMYYGPEQLFFFYLLKKDYAQAGVFCRQSMETARRSKEDRFLDDAYHNASMLELAEGHPDNFFRYDELKDSIDEILLSDKVVKNTQVLETKFSLHEKQAEIDDLQKQRRIQELELRQEHLLNAGLVGLVVVIILVGLLYRRNYRQRKRLLEAGAQLQQQRIAELEKEKQLLAVEAVLQGQIEERSRLAKDLHDGLGSILSGVKYSFTNMKDKLIITQEGAEAFDRGMGMLDKSIHELRRVAHNMMPEALMKFGLDTALEDFCRSIDESGAVKLTYASYHIDEPTIPETRAAAIYRVVQELVNNILKHAGATTALVQLIRKDNALSISVEDDGKGFDPAVLEESQGIGYLNLRNRVAWLNGTIDIQTEPGRGVSVNIEIPNVAT